MKKAQAEFIKVAIDMGVSSKRAHQLADELFHIPKNVSPNVKLDGIQKAIFQAQALRTAIANLRSKSVTITYAEVHEHEAQSAKGNIFTPYAAGGFENHIAQIGNGRMSRVWNEPETKGEAYIPLADDWRRPRAKEIWIETGRLLGMQAAEQSVTTREFAGAPSYSSAGGNSQGGSLDGWTRGDIERLIASTEAARTFRVGSRQFADAVQAAGNVRDRLSS